MTAPALDPRTGDFRWVDRPTKGARRLTPEQITAFNRDGMCIVRGVLTEAERAAVAAEIDALEAELERTVITLEGEVAFAYARDSMTFVKGPSLTAPATRAVLTGPVLADIAADLVGPAVRLYWDQGVYKASGGGPEFPWHQDNGYTFTRPLAYVTVWIALTDAGVDDGCPWVIPGVHVNGVYRHVHAEWGLDIEGADALAAAHPPVPAQVKAGDAVVFSSLTPHRTGANTTTRTRKALIAQYIAADAQVEGEDGVWRAVDDPDHNPIIAQRTD